MQDFRNLQVWQKAHQLTLDIYRNSRGFPDDERYGLTSQMRRACSSIPTNIAEGCGRGSDTDFARFIQIALGSASELDYHLILAQDLGYLPSESYLPLQAQASRVMRMLSGLRKKLQANSQ